MRLIDADAFFEDFPEIRDYEYASQEYEVADARENVHGGWIPCSERLPEPFSGEYLVTINDGSVYVDILMFDAPGDGMYESCFYKTDADGYPIIYRDVVAWQPLPECYKG